MMRRLAIDLGIPFITAIQGAKAAADAIEAVKRSELSVRSLQEFAKVAFSEQAASIIL